MPTKLGGKLGCSQEFELRPAELPATSCSSSAYRCSACLCACITSLQQSSVQAVLQGAHRQQWHPQQTPSMTQRASQADIQLQGHHVTQYLGNMMQRDDAIMQVHVLWMLCCCCWQAPSVLCSCYASFHCRTSKPVETLSWMQFSCMQRRRTRPW